LKALAGMDEEPPAAVVLLEPEVVVVDEEVVELQAVAPTAMARTMPSAVVRLFHDSERKAPP
jgi:hypothetical protein